MTEPKFCKDCKHYERDVPIISADGQTFGSLRLPKCKHPGNIGRSLVTGFEFAKGTPNELRWMSGKCGLDGNWFEAKPPEPAPKKTDAYYAQAFVDACPEAFAFDKRSREEKVAWLQAGMEKLKAKEKEPDDKWPFPIERAWFRRLLNI